jgi:hypothetical protein
MSDLANNMKPEEVFTKEEIELIREIFSEPDQQIVNELEEMASADANTITPPNWEESH